MVGMRTETTRCSEWWQKSNSLVERKGERCYSSKESNVQGIASEQSEQRPGDAHQNNVQMTLNLS